MSTMATPQKLWSCSDLDCTSDQTSLPRAEYGRKVVSDFFGRNKTFTKAIPEDVWHYQCRKGYQRGKYAADKGEAEKHLRFYMNHLHHQLVRIKIWRPECTFVVQLSQPAKNRLAAYHAALRKNGNDHAAAAASTAVVQKTGRAENGLALALADAVKPAHAGHIDTHFAGDDRSVDYVIGTILPWIEGEFKRGGMVRMPPVEFLINDPRQDEVINDPATNFAAWRAMQTAASPAATASKPNKRQREDDDDSSPRPPKKQPRLKALHGPRRPKPSTFQAGHDIFLPSSRYTTLISSLHSPAELEAAQTLLLLRQQHIPAPQPQRGASKNSTKISIASLLNPAPSTAPDAQARGILRAQRLEAAIARLPLYIPPPAPTPAKKTETKTRNGGAADLPLYVPPYIAQSIEKDPELDADVQSRFTQVDAEMILDEEDDDGEETETDGDYDGGDEDVGDDEDGDKGPSGKMIMARGKVYAAKK